VPSVAYEEWRRWPVGFLEDVIEVRGYAAAKRAVERTTDAAAKRNLMASWPLAALVWEIDIELVEAERHGE
jgi:hypothetical protein